MGEKRKLIYGLVIAFVVIAGIVYTVNYEKIQGEELLVFDEGFVETGESKDVTSEMFVEEKIICVQLCGEVKNEGIYNVPEGSRIYEVVELAGGLTNEAADNIVNQAREAKDGEMLIFPSKAEVESGLISGGGTQLVSLNSASKEQLMTLPGVGEAKAESIIEFREDNNGFDTIEQIMEVDGIKEAMFEKIKDLITI